MRTAKQSFRTPKENERDQLMPETQSKEKDETKLQTRFKLNMKRNRSLDLTSKY